MEKQTDIARTAGQIEDFFWGLRAEGGDQFFSPGNIKGEAKEPIVAVVGGGELGKKGLNPRSVIGRIQLAVDLAGVLGVVVAKVSAS